MQQAPRDPDLRGASHVVIFLIDLIIFDCDGVLVDSEPVAARVFSDMLGEYGLDISVEDVLTCFVGLSAGATRKRIEADHGIVLPHDHDARGDERLAAAFRSDLKPMTGIIPLLTTLDVPYCVASNSGHPRLAHTFAATGLTPLVTGRVFSADDVVHGKPAPDLFLHAAERMGDFAPERCLVIEDSFTGATARATA